MNKGFLLIGSIIFAVYIYLTIWNIMYSNKKQKEDNYPNLTESEISDAYAQGKKKEITD